MEMATDTQMSYMKLLVGTATAQVTREVFKIMRMVTTFLTAAALAMAWIMVKNGTDTAQFQPLLAGKIESMKVNFPIGDSNNDGYGYGYNYGFYDGHGEGGGLSILFGYTDDFSGGGSGKGYSSTVDDTAGHGDGCCFGDSFGNGAGYGFSFVGRIGFDCGKGYGNGVDTVSTATRRRD